MPAPITTTGKTLFDISSASSVGQQNIFAVINDALCKIDMSADEFDRYFRVQLMEQAMLTADAAAPALIESLDANARSELMKHNPRARKVMEEYAQRELALKASQIMNVHIDKPAMKRADATKLMDFALGAGPKYAGGVAVTIETLMGRFQDVDPESLTGQQRATYEAYGHRVTEKEKPRACPDPTNLLQQCAGGRKLIDKTGTFRQWQETPNVRFETLSATHYVCNALLFALKQAAEDKGFSQQQIVDHIQPNTNGIVENTNAVLKDKTVGLLDLPVREPIAPYTPPATTATPEQQKFFEVLSRVNVLTTTTSSNFDYHIRNRLSMVMLHSGKIAARDLGNRLNRDYGTHHDFNFEHTGGTSLAAAFKKIRIAITDDGSALSGSAPPIPNAEALRDDIIVSLTSHAKDRFEELLEQRVHVNGPLYSSTVEAGVTGMEEQFKGRLHYEDYDPARQMLAPYIDGSKALSDLSAEKLTYSWNRYTVEFPSERDYLITAIKEAARITAMQKQIGEFQMRKLETALVELDAAYRQATLSPEEIAKDKAAAARLAECEAANAQKKAEDDARKLAEAEAAKAQEKQKRENERREQELAAQKAFLPFVFASHAQRLFDRGNANVMLPNKPDERAHMLRLQDVVKRELLPVRAHINRGFEPQQALATALFNDAKSQTTRTIEHIVCDTKACDRDDAVMQKIATELKRSTSFQFDDSPAHQANKDHHAKLLDALAGAPLTIIAALGSEQEVAEVKKIQSELFPLKPKQDRLDDQQAAQRIRRRAELAVEALTRHGVDVPQALQAAATAAPVRPRVPVPAWAGIEKQVKDFLAESLRQKPPFTLFGCRLTPDADSNYNLIVSLSRWITKDGALVTDSRATTVNLGSAATEEAAAIRDRVQDLIRTQKPFLPNRPLQKDEVEITIGDITVPHEAPVRDVLTPKDGVWQQQMRFETVKPPLAAPVVTEIAIPLGMTQPNANRAEAQRRAGLVRDHLDSLRNDPEPPMITEQYIRDWLQNRVRNETDPALNKNWRGAARIDLTEKQYAAIATEITVDFPAGSQTKISVSHPTYRGEPNGEWKIKLTYRQPAADDDGGVSWPEMFTTEINTHLGGEQGAVKAIDTILQHNKDYLEEYARLHKDAKWHTDSDHKLDQYHYTQEHAGTIDIDATRIRWINGCLEFGCGMRSHAADATTYDEAGVATQPPQFTVGVMQADGVAFLARPSANSENIDPLQFTLRIDEKALSRDEVERRMELVNASVQEKFGMLLHKHFAVKIGESNGAPSIHFPPVNDEWQALAKYDPRSVRSWFEKALNETLAKPEIKELGVRAAGLSAAGGNGAVEKLKFHHAPSRDEREAMHGIKPRRFTDRGDGERQL